MLNKRDGFGQGRELYEEFDQLMADYPFDNLLSDWAYNDAISQGVDQVDAYLSSRKRPVVQDKLASLMKAKEVFDINNGRKVLEKDMMLTPKGRKEKASTRATKASALMAVGATSLSMGVLKVVVKAALNTKENIRVQSEVNEARQETLLQCLVIILEIHFD